MVGYSMTASGQLPMDMKDDDMEDDDLLWHMNAWTGENRGGEDVLEYFEKRLDKMWSELGIRLKQSKVTILLRHYVAEWTRKHCEGPYFKGWEPHEKVEFADELWQRTSRKFMAKGEEVFSQMTLHDLKNY